MISIARFRWALAAAIATYFLSAALLIFQNPGLQYDEALLVLGGVQMRHSPMEIGLPHDPDTWFHAFHRWYPLMTVRYVGAIKDYLSLPIFTLFGPSAPAVRTLSTLLGALGIWGLARLIGEHANRAAGAIAAFAIAINPAYLATTVFDNGTVAIWMAALGLLSLAISRYLRLRSPEAAFFVGAAMGLGVWARANFVWQVAAVVVAALVVARRRSLPPLSHWARWIGGGLVGGAPFLAYQILSKGGTWAALGIFETSDTLSHRLLIRIIYLSETFLSDREHRAMWAGPSMPDWEPWLLSIIVLASCAVCLATNAWSRAVTITFLVLGVFLFSTRMPVSEHHMIALVPLAAVISVLACLTVAKQYLWGKLLTVAIAALYLGLALFWQVAAIRGLSNTGGVGQWSDGIFVLAQELQNRYPGREIKILDWGLQNNLFVLTDARLNTREIYGDTVREENGRSWADEAREGGVFLLNGPENRQIPAASMGFLHALDEVHPKVKRLTITQESGTTFAEIIEVSAGQPLPSGAAR